MELGRSPENLAVSKDLPSPFNTDLEYQDNLKEGDNEDADLWSVVYQGDITQQHLQNIQQELGLITLCWEKVESAWLEGEIADSTTYSINSEKEKLLLWYAENFRQQFHQKFPSRRPILLACNNECGVQKMVCTTLRPTSLRYEAMQNLVECAAFFADHVKYIPLEKPTTFPDEIVSPGEVLMRQAGHCYELATLLASILIGASYNAFVVSGYASRHICLNDTTTTEFSSRKEEHLVEEKRASVANGKYSLEPARDLRSQFLLGQEEKKRAREVEARMAQLRAEEQAIRQFEKPPPDSLAGHRRHAWVLILPSKDVKEACFVEPASGAQKAIDDPEYLGVDSVWNHENYWVAVGHNRLLPFSNVLLDLNNLEYWEHLLLGAPACAGIHSAAIANDTDSDHNSVKREKHLDMPASWVKKIVLPHSDFERRYVDCQKTIRYRKCCVELFSPYSDIAGLSTRVTHYTDYDCQDVLSVDEQFCNREDRLHFIATRGQQVHHSFHHGRNDALKEFWFEDLGRGFPLKIRFQFYNNSRHDSLWNLCKEPYFMTEDFKNREDYLYFRHTIFNQNSEVENSILKIVEKFHRNLSKPVSEDAAIIEYDFENMKVCIVYQYGDEDITAATREFSLKEMKQIASYHPSPGAPPPQPLVLFNWLQGVSKSSELAKQNVRQREKEIEELLTKRGREMAEPRLTISPFDEERNEEAKHCYKERDRKLQEEAARDLSLEVDLLAPYIAALPIAQSEVPLSASIARNVYAKCLQDWKTILITRANDIHRQFELACDEMKECAESGSEKNNKRNPQYFRLHCLNVRLMRHKELAPQRYLAIEACLRADKRLVNAFD